MDGSPGMPGVEEWELCHAGRAEAIVTAVCYRTCFITGEGNACGNCYNGNNRKKGFGRNDLILHRSAFRCAGIFLFFLL